MPRDTETARWVGPFSPAEVDGVGLVETGQTAQVPLGTSDSNHWEAVGGSEAKSAKGAEG